MKSLAMERLWSGQKLDVEARLYNGPLFLPQQESISSAFPMV